MFLQLITPPVAGPPQPLAILGAIAQANADSLFVSHPLQISALVELVWLNRYNAANAASSLNTPFLAWPIEFINPILTSSFSLGYFPPGTATTLKPALLMPSGEAFTAPSAQPGILAAANAVSNWDHLIYAYTVENTRIFDIFSKVLETYMFTEQLETPSLATQMFLRNTEYLLYSDAMPSMVWTTTSRLRPDEIANRMTVYYRMFGMDLSHGKEIAARHPYEKPVAANREFVPTFEAFAREVWIGIQNAPNTSGANPTDNEAISTSASRLCNMLTVRRLNGNISREEFRAVACMSWLHLAVMYNSSVVQDLKATGPDPATRLQKIAERVGMSAHSKAKPLFDLSQDFSYLLQTIETGTYNTPLHAPFLYQPGSTTAANAEIVIDQYSLATDRDLKAPAVAITPRAVTAPPLRLSSPSAQSRAGSNAARAASP